VFLTGTTYGNAPADTLVVRRNNGVADHDAMYVGATGVTTFPQNVNMLQRLGVGTGLTSALTPIHVYNGTTGNTNGTLRLESAVSNYGSSNEGSSVELYTRWNGNGTSYFQSAIRGIDDNLNGAGSGDGGMSFVVNKNTVQTEAMRLNSNLAATFAGDVSILGSLTIASLLGNLVQQETWTWIGVGTTFYGYYCKLGNLLVRWGYPGNVNISGVGFQWDGPSYTDTDYFTTAISTGNVFFYRGNCGTNFVSHNASGGNSAGYIVCIGQAA
jgi:hypothetical protein